MFAVLVGRGGGLSQTLDAVLAKGQMMPEKNRFPVVITGGAYSLQNTIFTRKEARGNGLGISEEVSHTLLKSEIPGVAYKVSGVQAFRLQGRGKYVPGVGTLRKTGGNQNGGSESLLVYSLDNRPELILKEMNGTLTQNTEGLAVVYDTTQVTSKANGSNPQPGDPCHPLVKNGHAPLLLQGVTIHGTDKTVTTASLTETAQSLRTKPPGTVENSSTTVVLDPANLVVRRLTPLECERLQGFPDNYTNIPGASDTARYAAIGNSMTTNVMQWIGKRIQAVEEALLLQ
jgi:DNA (cytosine-5)-methyltransferase 1